MKYPKLRNLLVKYLKLFSMMVFPLMSLMFISCGNDDDDDNDAGNNSGNTVVIKFRDIKGIWMNESKKFEFDVAVAKAKGDAGGAPTCSDVMCAYDGNVDGIYFYSETDGHIVDFDCYKYHDDDAVLISTINCSDGKVYFEGRPRNFSYTCYYDGSKVSCFRKTYTMNINGTLSCSGYTYTRVRKY